MFSSLKNWTVEAKQNDRKFWMLFVFYFSFLQAIGCLLISLQYIPYISVEDAYAKLYLVAAYVYHFGLPSILTLCVTLIFVVFFPYRNAVVPLIGFFYCGIMFYLVLDTTIYRLYRFHFSPFIWELLIGPASGDLFNVSWFSLVSMVGVIGFLVIILVVFVLLGTYLARRFNSTKIIIITLTWFFSAVLSQTMHLWFEANYDTQITSITRHFPLYYPVTGKRLLQDLELVDFEDERIGRFRNKIVSSNDINYPQNELECISDEKKNVILIAIDAWRADVFEDGVMPNLSAMKNYENAQIFENHYSGGNVTKSGLFSLFYGLPASYWDAFSSNGVEPELVRIFQEQNYEIGIFSSASLLSPPFDKTIFSSISDLRTRSDGSSPSDRDIKSIQDFNEFIEDQNNIDPYFAFLFLDSAHSYDVPEGYEKFKPHWERVDHVLLNKKFDPIPYFNRYKNALYFLDDQVSSVIETIKQSEKYGDTIIIVTSDHGEEFNDLGQNYWGHGSNFAQYQTKVPMLIVWPNRPKRTYDHKTSHYDVAPTLLMDVFGCENSVNEYSIGNNLFEANASSDWLVIYSYFNYGIVTDESIISTHPIGSVEVLDRNNQAIKNGNIDSALGMEVLDALTRFYD